jgi:hypothetical protein
VTAVVLTIGESTLDRALASVERQTLRPAEVVVVRGVTPISAAVAVGVEEVRTPFFIQVDADMVLDETCVECLLGGMRPDVGIVASKLRDPLLGAVPAVKLFRRACFDLVSMPATVAQDSDYYERIGALGWTTIYLLSYGRSGTPHTLGEHRPEYGPDYTFATFFLLGCRIAYRQHADALHWRLRSLRASTHPMSSLARLALAHGLFSDDRRELPKWEVLADAGALDRLVAARPRFGSGPPSSALWSAPEGLCQEWYAHGRLLAACEDYAGLAGALQRLAAWREQLGWAAEVCLGHGFLSGAARAPGGDEIWERLRPLSPRGRL